MMPIKYPETPSAAVATYDFTDLAAGVGFRTFYGAVTNASGSNAYILTSQVVYSGLVETSQTNSGTTTMNFDLTPFVLPQVVASGSALFSAQLKQETSQYGRCKAQLYHVNSAGTATSISDQVTCPNIGTNTYLKALLPLSISTEKLFKKGEKIRCTVDLINDAGGGAVTTIAHDPQGLTGTRITTATAGVITVMTLKVPFEIET